MKDKSHREIDGFFSLVFIRKYGNFEVKQFH